MLQFCIEKRFKRLGDGLRKRYWHLTMDTKTYTSFMPFVSEIKRMLSDVLFTMSFLFLSQFLGGELTIPFSKKTMISTNIFLNSELVQMTFESI